MPILLDGKAALSSLDRGPYCPPSTKAAHSTSPYIHVGLINNMPDGALEATERQFFTLLDVAAGDHFVKLSLLALNDVPRTASGRQHISRFYTTIDNVWDRNLDGLIVTGTEPCTSSLTQEPYWGTLKKVVEWAEHNTHSTVWSCLAAHAALLHTDGIERRRLSSKRFGIFECTRSSDHHLTVGLPSAFEMPHSRWNDISEKDLRDCGYTLLSRAIDAGVDAFFKQKKSLFVFFQGHPEYEQDTLLLEYRRDVRRYLTGKRDTYPQIPQCYFDPDTGHALSLLGERARTQASDHLLADILSSLVGRGIANTWRPVAVGVYRNWLSYLSVVKEQSLKARFACVS